MSRVVLRLILDVVLTIVLSLLFLTLWQGFLSDFSGDAIAEAFRVLFNFMDVGLAIWVVLLIIWAIRGRTRGGGPSAARTFLFLLLGTVVNLIVVTIVGFIQGGAATLLVMFANMLGVEDGEPGPEHQQTTGERKEMDGIEEVQHASGKRQHRECADPPWAFRCRVGEKILERQAEKKAQSEKQAKVHGRRRGIHRQPPRFWSELKRATNPDLAGNSVARIEPMPWQAACVRNHSAAQPKGFSRD